MDPLSALSIASGVITFVDFGGKLITRFVEFRKSGMSQPGEVLSLNKAVEDLLSIASEAQKKVKDLGSSYPRQAASLARLEAECIEAQALLRTSLEQLTIKPSEISSFPKQFLAAIRGLWSDEKLKEWARKLDRIRDQVMMNVLLCLS
jgi:hypothetical protein